MGNSALSLEERIREVYDTLPSSERILADQILEFPGDIVIYSATDLAAKVSASNAAVTRLIKRLGYTDYREAQRQIRRAQEAGAPIYLNSSAVKPPTYASNLKTHIEQDLHNLTKTLESINSDHLNKAIKATIDARKVWVIGFRNSYFFASYIRRQLVQVRSDVTLLPAPGQVVVEDLGDIGKQDLVIAVGMRRRVPVLRHVMEALHKRSISIIYFTDRRAVATTKLARWVFPCHTRGISLFDSYVGLMSLLNFFCTEIVAGTGNEGRKHLQSIETLMKESKEIDSKN